MKRNIVFVVALFICTTLIGQEKSPRVKLLEKQLDSLAVIIPALSEKITLSLNQTDIASILSLITDEKKINFISHPDLKNKLVTYSFEEVSVKDLLLHFCDKFSLEINSTGSILSVKDYKEPKPIFKQKELFVEYDSTNDLFSIDVKKDSLPSVFKKITQVTGKNMLFGVGMESKTITTHIKNMPFEGAIDKIAFTNDLDVTKTKDGYYLFQLLEQGSITDITDSRRNGNNQQTPKRRYRASNFYFKVKDSINKILEVDFENEDVGVIVKDISYALNIDMYVDTDTNLSGLNKITFKTKEITFDDLLTKILQDEDSLTYKKENNVYYFTKGDKAAAKSYEVVPLMHRSIEMMSTPSGIKKNDYDYNSLFNSSNINNGIGTTNSNQTLNSNNGSRGNYNGGKGQVQNYKSKKEETPFEEIKSFYDLIPDEFKEKNDKEFNFKVDPELNSFIVSGDPEKIKRFRKFIKGIDKPIPVILIEVMIIEVNKTATVNTGVELGLGDAPVNDSGTLFPSTGVTLGATSLNKVIGGFNGFGSLNIGKVVPNFYAKIQAMETNGNIKIRSTPKLSTLNGHRAVLSNGERSYYAVVRRDIIGSQNPQTTEIRNYVPIDADLSISIKPMVAGDDQITMSINVLQSSFNEANRIDNEAPPGINSREFNSIIRVKNQDVVILGGLEEKLKNDSGSGVPFLARIPIIKWLFSKKTRIDSKKKLSVLIKPTIIR